MSNRSAITLADRRGSLLPRHRGVKFNATKGAEPEVARKRELPAGRTEHRSNSFLTLRATDTSKINPAQTSYDESEDGEDEHLAPGGSGNRAADEGEDSQMKHSRSPSFLATEVVANRHHSGLPKILGHSEARMCIESG